MKRSWWVCALAVVLSCSADRGYGGHSRFVTFGWGEHRFCRGHEELSYVFENGSVEHSQHKALNGGRPPLYFNVINNEIRDYFVTQHGPTSCYAAVLETALRYKRYDTSQAAIAKLLEHDLGVPLYDSATLPQMLYVVTSVATGEGVCYPFERFRTRGVPVDLGRLQVRLTAIDGTVVSARTMSHAFGTPNPSPGAVESLVPMGWLRNEGDAFPATIYPLQQSYDLAIAFSAGAAVVASLGNHHVVTVVAVQFHTSDDRWDDGVDDLMLSPDTKVTEDDRKDLILSPYTKIDEVAYLDPEDVVPKVHVSLGDAFLAATRFIVGVL
jgi:hypothetical protein